MTSDALDAAVALLILSIYAVVVVAIVVAIVLGVSKMFGRKADKEDECRSYCCAVGTVTMSRSEGVEQERIVAERDSSGVLIGYRHFAEYDDAVDCYESTVNYYREDAEKAGAL